MSRVPIRVRLAALLALAMMLVLAGAGLFVYLRLANDLDESVDSALEARAAAVSASGQVAAGDVGDDEDGIAQLLAPGGRVLAAVGGDRTAALRPAELARAAAGDDVQVERDVAGVDGTARLLAVARGRDVVVVGQSLDDRDETLASLAGAFALGGPVAALAVALLGYGLAAAGLRPVEQMRRRAAGVSLEDEERLPLPAARDEIRRLGETLNAMLDRLRGAYDRERRFVADASHELRTPVAVIKAELESALRRAPADPELREPLAAAVEECDRLAQLAEDLLVLARGGDGALPVHAVPLDVAELLDRIRTRFVARAAERGREIRVDADPGLAVRADELRLSQALGNLVDNALRHGAGAITLRGRPAAGSGVELEVADEGRGFAPGLAGRAFERFARGDEARARGGAGLGLAIVRAIAEAHGGTAELTGEATVRIRLPSQGDPSSRPYLVGMPTRGATT